MLSDIQNTKNFRMNGWHYDAGFYKDKINGGEMVSLVTETAKVCNFDCEYCFTDYKKRDEAGELTLNQRLDLIDQACAWVRELTK